MISTVGPPAGNVADRRDAASEHARGITRIDLLVKQDEDNFKSPRTGQTLQSGDRAGVGVMTCTTRADLLPVRLIPHTSSDGAERGARARTWWSRSA